MDIYELKRKLNSQSLEKIREALGDIKQMLTIRDQLKSILYNTELNYWEEAVKILDNGEFCQRVNKNKYIAFCLLYVDIRKYGLKFPIIIQRKREDGYPLDKWFLLNGHHRMVIAEELGITDIPIKFKDAEAEN